MKPVLVRRRISEGSAVFSVAIGALVLFGWLLDIGILKSILPTWTSMKAITAACLILVGVGLLARLQGQKQALRWVASACAIAVMACALLSLAEYVTGLDVGIDHLLFNEQAGTIATTYPGRMALTTSLSFVFLGWGILVWRQRGWRVQAPVIAAGCLSLLGIVGYLYDIEGLERIGPQFIAFHAAVTFLVLSTGMLAGHAETGPMRLVMDAGAGGVVLRQLLPAILFIPIVLGTVILAGSRKGLYQTETAWALFTVSTVVALGAVVGRGAYVLDRTDRALKASRGALQDVLESLEKRVQERTRELKESQGNLERERELLSTVIDSLPDIVFVKDRESRFVMVNRSLALLAGARDARELIGKTDFDISADDLARRYLRDDRRVMESATSLINVEEVFMHADGTPRWVLTTKVPFVDKTGTVNGLVGISRDVTERKAFEAQIQQTQKLESLGVLAGGIAHDFNNILMTILGNAELATAELPRGSSAHQNLSEIGKSAHRAADLCQQLLAYSGKGRFQMKALDLSALIQDMRGMLLVLVSKTALLRFDLSAGLPSIDADEGQVRQIVMNLAINASEAIGDRDGAITIATAVRDSSDALREGTWSAGPPAPGRCVSLVVTDTGSGMDERTRERIFEPFFTTKFAGRGLGLSAVMGIVQRHRGAIRVQSAPGAGTTFTLLVPARVEPDRP